MCISTMFRTISAFTITDGYQSGKMLKALEGNASAWAFTGMITILPTMATGIFALKFVNS